MPSPTVRLQLLLVMLLGFAAWALGLTWNVQQLRGQIEEQVGWLIATSAWERAPGSEEAAADVREMLPAMEARLATDPASRLVFSDASAALASDDLQGQKAAAAAITPYIRSANATVSVKLGNRWDQVTILTLLSVAFAFGALLSQALRVQDQEAREKSERALSAANDRLSRVGVGLLCIDADNNVRTANAVASGLASARASIDHWWKAVDGSMKRPGTVPCKLCGKPVPLGRCEVKDATRMGSRVVEVVFGGHAHDLEYGDDVVVLVRDITDLRKRQVLGGVNARHADLQSVARGLSRGVSSTAATLADRLEAIDASDEALAPSREVAQQLQRFADGLALLSSDRSGPCDVSQVVTAVEELVRPQLPDSIRFEVRSDDLLRGHARRARLTQALLAVVLRSVDACDDGEPHQIEVDARRAGSTVQVVVSDDRSQWNPGMRSPKSVTRELFRAAGATFVREDEASMHRANITVAAIA